MADGFSSHRIGKLTSRQGEVLALIQSIVTERGVSPTLHELRVRLGLRSIATVHKLVTYLHVKGFVTRSHQGIRSTVPTGGGGSFTDAKRNAADALRQLAKFSEHHDLLLTGSGWERSSPTLLRRVYNEKFTCRPNRESIGAKVRFAVFRRDTFRCTYCGRDSKEVQLEVDHIIPLTKGGSDDPSNLTTSCWECNLGKFNSVLSEQAESRVVAPQPRDDG